MNLLNVLACSFPSSPDDDWWKGRFYVYKRYAQWKSRRKDLLSVLTESDEKVSEFWGFSVPWVDGFGGSVSFTPFGLIDLATEDFSIRWAADFSGSGTGPDILAYTWGHIRFSNTSGSYEYGTLTLHVGSYFDFVRSFAEVEEPSWLPWPTRVVYRYLETDTVRTALTNLIEARHPEGEDGTDDWLRFLLVTQKQASGSACMTESEFDTKTTYAAKVEALRDAIIDGSFTRWLVSPGDVLGKAYAPSGVSTSTDRSLDLRVHPDEIAADIEDIALDPAYFLLRFPELTYGISTGTTPHQSADDFFDHRGVLMCRVESDAGKVYTLGTDTLTTVLSLVESAGDSYAVIVLDSTSDWRDGTAEGRTPGTDQSTIELSYPVNLISDGTTRMFRPVLKDRDGNDLESSSSLLDAVKADPAPSATEQGDLYSDLDPSNYHDQKFQTRPLKVTATDGTNVAWESDKSYASASDPGTSWLPTASGVMAVIKGNWGGGADDQPDENVRLDGQENSYRGLRISIDEADLSGGVVSIANLAFIQGAPQTDEGGSTPDAHAGGGVAVIGTDRVYLNNCIFFRNKAARIFGGNSGDNMYRGAGAGIYIQGCSPLIDGCYFARGEANTGGGLSAWSGSWPIVRNRVFWKNRSAQGGGMDQLQFPFVAGMEDITSSFIETLVSDSDKYEWPGRGPTRISHCVFCTNEVVDDGGNLYGTVWTHYFVRRSVFRYGLAGSASEALADFTGGGGNIRVTTGSDLVLVACTVQKGKTEAPEVQQAGGGNIQVQNSDLALVADFDDTDATEVSHGVAENFAGGGIMFTANWPDWKFSPLLELFNMYEGGDEDYPGNACLILANATLSENSTPSTAYGKGGAIYAYREGAVVVDVQTVVVRMQGGEVIFANNSANEQHDGHDTHHYLLVDDEEGGAYESDTDIGMTSTSGGTLTSDHSYESLAP